MYFWRIDNLKTELASRPMTDREVLPYVVVDSVLTTLAIALPNERSNLWDGLGLIWGVALAVFGTIYTFRQNGGAQGQQFLPRAFAIWWVVGLRWCAWVIPIYAICLGAGLFEAETNVLEFLFTGSTDTLFVTRVAAHLRDVARHGPPSDAQAQTT